MNILVTGAAGFIGSALSTQLLSLGHCIIGIDNLNAYYDVTLKKNRLSRLEHPNFTFECRDVSNKEDVETIFSKHRIQIVIHLAAQVGVRYSVSNPYSYSESNLVGFVNILEACRQHRIQHFIFASSSSVYGANAHVPFSENDMTDRPCSLYAATKKANELMAYSYAHLYQLPCTGLRFFTVYGPWGRPDMAMFHFTQQIFEEKPITVFNNGNMLRDFTYIDDVVAGIIQVIPNTSEGDTPYQIFNVGNSNPVKLNEFIEILEKNIRKKAIIEYKPMHIADMLETYADMSLFEKQIGTIPHTSIEKGIAEFVLWYKAYYAVVEEKI